MTVQLATLRIWSAKDSDAAGSTRFAARSSRPIRVLSEDTVKAHIRSIHAKLDVNDRTQAVTTALRRGIIAL